MDSEALKPCPVPWCGRNAELKGDDDIYFTEPPSAIVVCTECGLETPIFETHAEAITAWNTRAEGSEAQAKTIEALQADNAKLRTALLPFARHVGKVDALVILKIGADTWTGTLTGQDFANAYHEVNLANPKYREWLALQETGQ